jgi:hypothetical protein
VQEQRDFLKLALQLMSFKNMKQVMKAMKNEVPKLLGFQKC